MSSSCTAIKAFATWLKSTKFSFRMSISGEYTYISSSLVMCSRVRMMLKVVRKSSRPKITFPESLTYLERHILMLNRYPE